MVDIPEGLNIPSGDGWAGTLGYMIAAGIVGWQTVKKYLSEQRGESRELDRLLTALADERQVNRELRQQRDDAWDDRDAANARVNEMFRELADLKASNVRLEERVTYLTSQIETMKNYRSAP